MTKAKKATRNILHVKKGDTVKVLAGKDKGKQGKVLRAIPEKNRVVVEKINIAKKAMRPTQQNPQGGIMSVEAPIHVSNVALVCPKCGEATRAARRREGGKKIRVCKKCNADID
jgi:large subunit ribosomal protein L24